MVVRSDGMVLVSFWYSAVVTSWCTSLERESVGYVEPVGVSWFSGVMGRLWTCMVVASAW